MDIEAVDWTGLNKLVDQTAVNRFLELIQTDQALQVQREYWKEEEDKHRRIYRGLIEDISRLESKRDDLQAESDQLVTYIDIQRSRLAVIEEPKQAEYANYCANSWERLLLSPALTLDDFGSCRWNKKKRIGFHVYALIRDAEIVYVGESKQVTLRISAHKANQMGFDSVKIVALPDKETMDRVEGIGIHALHPVLNHHCPVCRCFLDDGQPRGQVES